MFSFDILRARPCHELTGTMSILGAKRINPLGPAGSRVLLWVRAAAGFGFMSTLVGQLMAVGNWPVICFHSFCFQFCHACLPCSFPYLPILSRWLLLCDSAFAVKGLERSEI